MEWAGLPANALEMPQDLPGALAKVTGTTTAATMCRNMMLSNPSSYGYSAFAVGTAPQLIMADVVQSARLWYAGIVDNIGSADMVAVGCPSNYPNGVRFNAVDTDITASDITSYFWGGQVDIGGKPLPTSLSRLKEGVERFFVTDINNAAGSSKAQSSLMVMFDAWGASRAYAGAQYREIASFNHLPGGSNIPVHGRTRRVAEVRRHLVAEPDGQLARGVQHRFLRGATADAASG